MTPATRRLPRIDPILMVAIHLAAGFTLAASSVVDLPGALQLGPVTSQAILTGTYLLLGLILFSLVPNTWPPLPAATIPLVLFLVWASLSLVWTPAIVNGIQNVLVVAAFLAMLLVSEATAAQIPAFASTIDTCVVVATLVSCAIYSGSLLFDDLGTNSVLGARSFGLFALFGVASYVSRWRYRQTAASLKAGAITFIIGMSLSRLALGIAIALFPLSQLPTRGIARFFRVAAVLGLAGICSYAAFLYVEPLRERFLSGDVSLRIGTVGINVSGRLAFWRTTLDSIAESPVVGKGAGSTEGLIEATFTGIRHPHSDYLRIAHDYGAIGLLLWFLAIGVLLLRLWRSWRRSDGHADKSARIYLTAFLSLCAFTMQMTMENAMVYIFVAAPLGLVVGAALGLERYESGQHSRRA